MAILRLSNPRVLASGLCLLLWCTAVFGAPPAGMASPRIHFDVPAGDAAVTLQLFTKQSGAQILYAVEQVRGHRTPAVRGYMAAADALALMLIPAGLEAVRDAPSGATVVRVSGPSAVDLRLSAEQARSTSASAARGARSSDAKSDLVLLSPFEVQSRSDSGYKAANSVSATRIAVPTGQLPMTVTTFTEAFIADQKPYDLYDVVKWSPGVHQDNLSPQGWVRYNIRGFTSAAVQRNGFGSFRFIDTTDIARVEVVKGPVSLLYGQINPGGVINYITKRPEAKPHLEITTDVGTNSYDRVAVDATGPLGGRSDVLYRAIAMYEDIPQFQVLSHGKKYLLAPSMTWRISDRAVVTVDYEHFARLDTMLTGGVVLKYVNSAGTVPYPGLPWNFSYAGDGDYQNFISDAVTADFSARLAEHFDLRATYLDSYWDMDWRATGQGGTGLISQAAIDAYYPSSAGLTPADAMYRRNRWEHQWGGERTAQVDLVGHYPLASGVNLRLLAGDKENFSTRLRAVQKNNPNVPGSPYYLAPWDLRNPATWTRAVPFGINALVPVADASNSSDAASRYFVLSATALDERLCVLAGYAHHELHNDAGGDPIAGTATAASNRSANIPQLGALLRVANGVSVFATYSESFLANATMLRVNNIPATPAVPSVGKGWEAGFKLGLWDGKLTGTVSVYRVTASPTGITTVTSGVDSTGTTLFTDVQGGSQLSRGAEVDLLYTPIDGLEITAGFSRCDAIYERNPVNSLLNGAPLVATPDRAFNVWGRYSVQRGPLAGLRLAGGFNHVGSMSYVANNPYVRSRPYTTADATIGYGFHAAHRRWTAELTVKNLGNVHYYESNSSWGFPRHVMVSLSTRF